MSKRIVLIALSAVMFFSFGYAETMQPLIGKVASQEVRGVPISPQRDVPAYNISVTPTSIMTSYYDYMMGGYEHLPMQVIPPSAGGGYMISYHGQRTTDSQRRAFYSRISNTGQVLANNEISSTNVREGYPSLIIDPTTGKPLYAWHASTDADAQLEVIFTSDKFINSVSGLFNTLGIAINNPITITAPNGTTTTDNEFIWPVLTVGPSPVSGKRRAYIAARNTVNHSTGISENSYVAYTDFNQADIENGATFSWSYTSVPELNNWNTDTATFRRLYSGFVADPLGNIYIVGYHYCSSGTPEPDLDVFICNNYGTGTWRKVSAYSNIPSWNPEGYFLDSSSVPFDDSELNWKIDNSGHINVIVDADGNLQMTGIWALINSEGSYYPAFQVVKQFIFNTTTETFEIRDVYPTCGNPNGHYQPWDAVAPWGEVDSHDYYGYPTIRSTYPFPHWDSTLHDNAMMFHYNTVKTSEPNPQQMMACVWQDSNRARQYNYSSNADYAAYANTPEIFLAVSPNDGKTWSEPIVLNNVDTPAFAGIKPMWAYPANQVIFTGMQDNKKVGKIGLLFYDDFTWGTTAIAPAAHPTNDGGRVMFTELEVVFPLINALEGVVLDGNSQAIEGAVITIVGTANTATTDANGHYSFVSLPAGAYTLRVTKPGYVTQDHAISIQDYVTTTCNLNMGELVFVTVTGRVVNTHNTDIGVSGATVELNGSPSYSTVSGGNGDFTLSVVLGVNSYSLVISKAGYTSHSANLEIGANSVLDLGLIPLTVLGYATTVAQYQFSSELGTYSEFSTGTVLGTSANDNEVFPGIPLGFNFYFGGSFYSSISVAANGFVAMGDSIITSNVPISSASGTNYLTSAMGRDIKSRDTGDLRYSQSGTAPNRVFTVQWRHYRRVPSTCANDDFSFQISLYENGGLVKFTYGSCFAVTSPTAAAIQVGLRGANNADFATRMTTSDWASTTAGTANSSSCTLSNTVYPTQGQTFTFDPNPSGVLCVFGRVVNAHNTAMGISGAVVSLQGATQHMVIAGPQGYYQIIGVIPNSWYDYTVCSSGMSAAVGGFQVAYGDYDMGQIALNEILDPPHSVSAVDNSSNVRINWYSPLEEEDFENGNFSSFPWFLWGNSPWTITNQLPHAGGLCAKSGVVASNQTSNMQLTLNVIEAGEISFWYKVSSEQADDFLQFYLDGSVVGSWSGEVPWTEFSYPVGVGEHIFRWSYANNPGADSGNNCAWIDDICFPQLTHINSKAFCAGPTDNHGAQLSRSFLGYRIWRLTEGDEANEAGWEDLWASDFPDTTFVDMNWTALADGAYRWAVKAVYSGSQYSSPVFSNVIVRYTPYADISVDPTSLTADLVPGGTANHVLTISNNGNIDLDVDINITLAGTRMASGKKTSAEVLLKQTCTEPTTGSSANCSFSTGTDLQENELSISQTSSLISEAQPTSRTGESVLIIRDNTAWNANVIVPLLQSYGAIVTVVPSSQMATVNLTQYDLVIIESQQTSAFYATYVNNLSRFTSYVTGGGFLELHTATYSSYRYPNLPIPGGTSTGSSESLQSYNYVVDASHPIVSGLASSLYGNSASHEVFSGYPVGTTIITATSTGAPTTIEYQLGSGRILATGMCWEYNYNSGYSSGAMLPLALQYSLSECSSSWLSVSPTSVTVSPGMSTQVTVTFNAGGMTNGVYHKNISISSNDPDLPVVTVPVTMNVFEALNPPTNVVATSAANQVNIIWSAPNTRSLEGYKVWRLISGNEANEASWTLLTSSVISSTSLVDVYPFILPAGNYKWAVKAVYTNSSYSTAAISNAVFLAMEFPEIQLSSTTLSANLISGAVSQQTLTISNPGELPLTFDITELSRAVREVVPDAIIEIQKTKPWDGRGDDPNGYDPLQAALCKPGLPGWNSTSSALGTNSEPSRVLDWLTEDPSFGTIPALGSLGINITFNSTGLAGGAYSGQLQINSNDPLNPTLYVSISLNVTQANYTTIDNENNANTHVADGDMDLYLYNSNSVHPIEFDIFVSNMAFTSAQLSILAYDIDETSGEIDRVAFNGVTVGYLTGANNQWSTTVLDINPALVNPGPSGVNLVQVFVDINNAGWATTVDWGQLVFNNVAGQAYIRYVATNDSLYTTGMNVSVTQEVDTNLSSHQIRIETNVLDPSGVNVDGASSVYTIHGTLNDAATTQRFIPAGTVYGVYHIQTIVYDNATNLQQELLLTPFTVIQPGPKFSFDPPGLDLGTVYVTDTLVVAIQISNLGYNTLNISSLSIANSAFGISQSSFSIPRLQARELVITYKPTVAASLNINMQVASNDISTPSYGYPITVNSPLYPPPQYSGILPEQVNHNYLNYWQVLAQVSFSDNMIVDASTLQYRYDKNGNGTYDSTEPWTSITGHSNAMQINITQALSWRRDGDHLCFEFRAQNLRRSGWRYTGTANAEGIADDFYVRLDATAPLWIDYLSVVSTGTGSVTLEWTPSADPRFANYEVYYAPHSPLSELDNKWDNNDDPGLAMVATTTTTITGLNPGTTYYFAIRGRDSVGNAGDFSDEISAITGTAAMVSNATITRIGGNAQLSWAAFPGATIYTIYVADTPEGQWTPLGNTSALIYPINLQLSRAFYRITATTNPVRN